MSDVDLSKLSKWIGKAKQLSEPPTAESAAQRAHPADGRDVLVQFNVKVAASVKKRAKQLAARDDIQLGMLVERMVDLYEEKYGALTETTAKHR